MNTRDRLVRRVVRRLGSDRTHVVDVPVSAPLPMEFMGHACTGIRTPVVAVCRTELRDRTGAVICMNPGTRIRCTTCTRLTGIQVAPDDNTALAAPQ